MNQDAGPAREISSTARDSMLLNALKQVVAWGFKRLGRILLMLNLLALIGHFARGRSLWLEILLYFSLLPLGLAAVLVGVIVRGLKPRKEGAAVALLGVMSIVVGSWWMIGRGPASTGIISTQTPIIRLLHWNVLWGGFADLTGGWASMVEEIASRSPDIIVLSEAAPESQRRTLIARLGTGWTELVAESPPEMVTYKVGLVILSRWPMRFVGMPKIRNGSAFDVIVDHPTQPIRVLTIDGKSRPTIPRSPMLQDIAEVCKQSVAESSEQIDVVLGDFNCVGRTRGFDQLRQAGMGYSLASQSSTGWRATWPSWMPIYDIDHIWVRNAIGIRSCTMFSRFASDHRGQIVELSLPELP